MNLRRFRALARNWEAYGHTDPFFGVLSDPTKHGGKWEVEEFFASGRAHVQNLIRTLHDLRVPFDRGTCLDFGCGVGRLTIPLSDYFNRTVGVDVARSMIDLARRYRRSGDRCEFVVNRDPDLRQFPESTFDFVHSCLVLQHVPPEIAIRYVGEFFRVCKPGGIVVFQLPSETLPGSVVSAVYALPESAHVALITISDPPTSLEPSQMTTLRIAVTNNSDVAWRHDIPPGRHIEIGNHWLNEDGTMAICDDGRASLPGTIGPGESFEVALRVQAPRKAANYLIEIDLVQELTCWFAEKGSKAVRAEVKVRTSVIQRILRPFRSGTPSFEMCTVPRPEVERAVGASGGDLLRAVEDNAAGYRWCSYTYVCRRLPT